MERVPLGTQRLADSPHIQFRYAVQHSKELHIFADASEKAIAAVVYLKTASSDKEQISIVLGKAKVAPKHTLTMPHMDLCAALLAAEMGSFIQHNLMLNIDLTVDYSDSKVALGYIKNRTRRFYIYVG